MKENNEGREKERNSETRKRQGRMRERKGERKMKGTCRLVEAEDERKSDEGKRDSWRSV